jgi:Cys-tRNA(Pro)/Cys-tRNA(Cys) deacylase
MAAVNNVTRLLIAKGIPFTPFELPAEKLSAVDVAGLIGVDASLVYKTIVVTRERSRRPLLVLVPADATIDLKRVAAAVGEKKVYLPTEREAEALTGLQAGGISPLALINKGFDVLLDASALRVPQVHVSGGQRGLNIRLPVSDLIQVTNARTASVALVSDAGDS